MSEYIELFRQLKSMTTLALERHLLPVMRRSPLAHPVEGVRLLGLVALLLRELREVLRGRLPVDEGVVPSLGNALKAI